MATASARGSNKAGRHCRRRRRCWTWRRRECLTSSSTKGAMAAPRHRSCSCAMPPRRAGALPPAESGRERKRNSWMLDGELDASGVHRYPSYLSAIAAPCRHAPGSDCRFGQIFPGWSPLPTRSTLELRVSWAFDLQRICARTGHFLDRFYRLHPCAAGASFPFSV